MGFLFKPKVVETPSIIGKNIQEAMRIVSKQGLSIKLIEEREDPEIPAGIVISQIPHAQSRIKVHQPISCIVSKKTGKVAPICIGKRLDEIDENCKKLGITFKHYPVSSSQPEGICIAQDPAPSTMLSDPSLILYISAGNHEPYLFPNLVQQPVKDVINFLKSVNAELELIHVHEQPEGHQCKDCIVAKQDPRAGTPVYLDPQKPIHVQIHVVTVEPTTTS